jgi:hypothetical protein
MEQIQNYFRIKDKGPDLIDEVDSETTYLGYLPEGATIAEVTAGEANCIICKINKSGTVTKTLWADGNTTRFNQIWNDRLTLTYDFKK